MVDIEGLRYRWPGAERDTVRLDRLRLSAGASLFLHGPSGAGKSTLLGLLAGVLMPQEGHVSVLGTRWSALSGARRDGFRADHVGYIFQQFNLLPYLGAIDNVLLPCRFSRLRHERASDQPGGPAAAARRLLEQVGLQARDWQRAASTLSVGQQQRVAAARALIGQPELIIADEPTSALDADLREAFMDVLLGQCRRAGSALVFVSHDERLAARFDSRVAIAPPSPAEDSPRSTP